MPYSYVIIDSAIFKNLLSENAKRFILSNKGMISKTFFLETKLYMSVLNNSRRRVLAYNLKTIVNMIKGNNYHMLASAQPFDIRPYAEMLSQRGEKVCVMTEDELLIERLLSGSAPVDVYDLNTDELKAHASFKLHITVGSDHGAHTSERVTGIKEGSRLLSSGRDSVVLGAKLNSGGREGKIYSVRGKPDMVAKIYKRYPSKEKAAHLERLAATGRRINAEWCLFPTTLLYHEGSLVGILMRKAENKMLSDDSLFLGDDESIDNPRLLVKRSYTLRFCLTVLAQVKVLNCYGILVSDYNDGNFSIFIEGAPVTMYDADSFSAGSYSGKIVDDSCFSRKYNTEEKEQLCELCDEGALKLVFRLISLGLYPFAGREQPYEFTDHTSSFDYRRGYFPENVLTYLGEVFTAREVPSLSMAIYAIQTALDELDRSPEKDVSVYRMREEALDCAAPFTVTSNDAPLRAAARGEPHINYANISSFLVPEPTRKVRRKRKHSFWPWAASMLFLLMGTAACVLISQGIITI